MAGGFAAGFGQSFSEAFNQQRQRSHERETDEFRYRMETLIKRKDKYDASKAEDTKATKLAKEVVQLTGQPPEAIGTARELLLNGANYDDVVKQFEAKTYKPKQGPEAPDPASAQTEESGLATTPEATTTTPAPTGMDGGGFLSKIFPGMKKFNPGTSGSRTDERVTKTTGMTPEEIAEIDQGYTPPEMSSMGGTWENKPTSTNDPIEAKRLMDEAYYALEQDPQNPDLKASADAMARQYTSVLSGNLAKSKTSSEAVASGQALGSMEVVAIGPDGQRKTFLANQVLDQQGNVAYVDPNTGEQLKQARAITPVEKDTGERIAKNLQEPFKKHDADAQNLAGAYNAYGIARKLIADNPEIINDRAADADQYLVDLGKDIMSGMSIVEQILADPQSAANADPSVLEDTKKKIENAQNTMQLGPAQKIAAARGLLKVQYALGAYHLASAVGQSDKNVAEKERIMLTELPKQATSLAAWDQLIGGILVPRKNALNQNAKRLPEMDPEFKPFKDRYGYSPIGEINPLESYIGESVEASDLDRTLPQSGFGAVVTPDEAKAPPSTEGTEPAPMTKSDYDALPPGTKYKHPDGSIKIKGGK